MNEVNPTANTAPVNAAAAAPEQEVATLDSMSMDDIFDIVVDDIVPVRFEHLPAGLFLFEFDDIVTDKRDGKVIIRIQYKTCDVLSIVALPVGKKDEDYLGKFHSQTFWIETKEDIGKLRAHAEDLGLESTGMVRDVCGRIAEVVPFQAQIIHKPKTDGSGDVYVNMKLKAPKADAA